MPHWLWYVGAALVVGIYFYITWKEKQKTHSDYAQLAAGLGWRYEKYSTDYNSRYRTYSPFDDGKRPRADHVFRGSHRGRPLVVFQYSADFQYTEGRSKRQHWQVTVVGMAEEVSTLEVGPRGTLGRIAQRAGLGQSTGDDYFDRRYSVKTADTDLAARLLNDDVRSLLRRRKDDANLLIHGTDIVTWREGPLYPDDMEPWADLLNDVLDRAGLE